MKNSVSKKEIKCIDLFTGAGGFSAGAEEAGFDVSGAVEMESVYSRTHQFNFPSSKIITQDLKEMPPQKFSQITDIKKGDIKAIIGSPPCQTFSTIGISKIRSLTKKDALTDPRNYLFREYFEYVNFFDPPIFVMENVPAMRTRYKGELFERILETINSLKYNASVAILNAVEFGVPQIRKRLFLVGTKRDIKFRFPEPTHRGMENTSFVKQEDLLEGRVPKKLKPAVTVREAFDDLPNIYDGCREDKLTYSKNTGLSKYQRQMRNKNGTVKNNICRVSNDRAKKIFAYMKQGDKYMDLPPKVRRILPFREDIFFDRLKRLSFDKPAWTVLAHIGIDGYMYIHPKEDRTLSVREAARLQGFQDSFIFCGNMREQYIQVGNAVPPLLSRAVAGSVRKALGENA